MNQPALDSYDARLKTFKDWKYEGEQSARHLARLGFYYAGQGDETFCVWCGGGLRDWLPTDNPFLEHARLYPTCPNTPAIALETAESVQKGGGGLLAPRPTDPLQLTEGPPLCVICQTAQRSTVFLPCRHLACCNECCARLAERQKFSCVICRQKVQHLIELRPLNRE
jgi:hypothetical protein